MPFESSSVRDVRVEPSTAREVAATFELARSTPDAPLVAAAYAQLEVQTHAMFSDITGGGRRRAIRVEFTRSAVPYCGDTELIDAVRAERVLEVTTSACDRDRRHPLLECCPGGAYDRFRAVHDILGHVRPALGFDRRADSAMDTANAVASPGTRAAERCPVPGTLNSRMSLRSQKISVFINRNLGLKAVPYALREVAQAVLRSASRLSTVGVARDA